jgi:DNA-binding MarR family transcriptional regulator
VKLQVVFQVSNARKDAQDVETCEIPNERACDLEINRIGITENRAQKRLSYASNRRESGGIDLWFPQAHKMTKYQVLAAFARANHLLSPDELRARLGWRLDRRSVYSYLLRLSRQGLLEQRRSPVRGRLAYRLTERGHARMEYFRRRLKKAPPSV